MDDNISSVVGITACSSGQMKNQTQTKAKTRSKSKKKPIKVVYISNPMKVTTSASEFRALVQQLTGQDADDLPDLHHTANPKVEISSSRQLPEISNSKTTCTQYYDDQDEQNQHLYADVDGLFVPEMLDSFKGLL